MWPAGPPPQAVCSAAEHLSAGRWGGVHREPAWGRAPALGLPGLGKSTGILGQTPDNQFSQRMTAGIPLKTPTTAVCEQAIGDIIAVIAEVAWGLYK